ncbi:heterokaryon incompatibility protein [Fusarium langsethiae]|uniref:Heterokaryon incompatibility protein n=1 Tax=Fusarium langsethiae TaxID=179993 RepID=A0A0M9ERY2_FUSLA|nr:heterokaryon incompatibility protein [Fusarium langsethiae]
MTSALQYRPLLRNEIRLLKIEDSDPFDELTNTTENRPIVCSLEHVCLVGANELPNSPSKGSDGTWPELPTHHDFAPLFKTGRDIRAEEENDTTTAGPNTLDEDHLPWRYPWGDFIALSYVWSHPKRQEGEPPYTVVIDGSLFEVTPNLYHALAQLSRSYRIRQGFKLWADAICINQSDADERGQQVALMRDIYQSAWQVAVWIGPLDEDSQLAFLALHWLSRESKRQNPMEGFYRQGFSLDLRPLMIVLPSYENPMTKAAYRALFHFFTRPYWRRMWIVQEVAMGKPNTPVICGDNCISWKDLHGAVSLIATDEARFGREVLGSVRPQILSKWAFEIARDRVAEERDWAPGRMWKVQQTIMSLQNHQVSESRGGWGMLVQALNIVRDSLATEERDRVYGVLGLKAITDSLVWDKTPDYTMPLDRLYIDFTSGFMEAGDLRILRLVSRHSGPRRAMQKTVSDLPPMLRREYTAPLALWIVGLQGKSSTAGTLSPTAHLGGGYQADASLGQSVPVFLRDKTRLDLQETPSGEQ